jgi:hypothetical protein
VNKDGTTSFLSSSRNPSIQGQAVTFTALVQANAPGSGTPTGTVAFRDGQTLLATRTLNGQGMAAFSTSSLSFGNHPITVVYSGDTNFTTSVSATLTQRVTFFAAMQHAPTASALADAAFIADPGLAAGSDPDDLSAADPLLRRRLRHHG